jgi:hypothetical protein
VRPDPNQSRLNHRSREGGVFGKKPISGMNGVGTGLLRDRYEPTRVEVTGGGSRFAKQKRLVSHCNVQRIAVALGIHGDGMQPHLLCSSQNAHGDLAAVCN